MGVIWDEFVDCCGKEGLCGRVCGFAAWWGEGGIMVLLCNGGIYFSGIKRAEPFGKMFIINYLVDIF